MKNKIQEARLKGERAGHADALKLNDDPGSIDLTENPYGMDSEPAEYEAWEAGYENGLELNMELNKKTPTTAGHTPIPWRVEYNRYYHRYQLNSEISGSFGHFQGWSSDGVTTEEEDDANAQFIVTACNHHEALVTCLRDCVESLKRLPDRPGAYRVTCIHQIQTLLARINAK